RAKLRAEEEVEAIFAQQEAENEYYKRIAEEARVREGEERRQKEEERRHKEEAQIKLARLLLGTGMSVEEVALETGLSEEEVEKIR
ncbi:MAG TPA: hypothetical protein PK198_25475, partial [Saprospiraceae bacterium]|nr:hypothetical protein [Saprospiraceae bacterium]